MTITFITTESDGTEIYEFDFLDSEGISQWNYVAEHKNYQDLMKHIINIKRECPNDLVINYMGIDELTIHEFIQDNLYNKTYIQDNLPLGSIDHLKNSISYAIYDYILKNPKSFHKDHRGISAQRKKYVKIRDGYRCQFCGDKFEEEDLVVDHIFPHSFGGSNEVYNLMALCKDCNSDKNASLGYYRSEEGRLKLIENIKKFVVTLLIIHDFKDWLMKMGDGRRRK